MRDDAASNPLSFVVAGSLIIGVIGVALFATEDIGGPTAISSGEAANRESQAQSLLSLMVDAPPDATGTGRLSLKDTDGSLAIQKFRSLQLTKFTEDDTQPLAYPTVRADLGITGGDFHIRSYPTLQSMRDQLGNTKDPNLKVVYVGHAETKFNGGAPTVGGVRCSVSAWDTDSLHIKVAVTNPGSTATQFQLVLTLDNGGKNKITIRDQTGLLAANGGTDTVTFDVPHTAAAACKSTTDISVSLYGTSRRLVAQEVHPATTATPAAIAEGIPILLPAVFGVSGQTVTVEYTADKDDKLDWKLHRNGASVAPAANDLASGCLPDATEPCSATYVVPNKGSSFTFTAPTVASPTEFTLQVHHKQHGATATQRLLVVPSEDPMPGFVQQTGTSSFAFDEAMPIEVDAIDQLIMHFNQALHDNTGSGGGASPGWNAICPTAPSCPGWGGSGGDVFWDEKKVLTESLPERLKYSDAATCTEANEETMPDIVVVGSNVDHNAMTSGNFKIPLKDWVVCGGLLIVFGSPEASTQWLQPIFHVGAQTNTGGISAPDTTHPLLRVPNNLDFEVYNNHGRTWRYTANAEEYFTNIVNQGDAPVTAISDPGDFGRGSVLISNWLPYDLFGNGAGSGDQVLHIMDNFLTQAYRDLFLDYGPPIPSDAPVVPAIRQSQIVLSPTSGETNYHPMCKNSGGTNCHVDMTVLLYLF